MKKKIGFSAVITILVSVFITVLVVCHFNITNSYSAIFKNNHSYQTIDNISFVNEDNEVVDSELITEDSNYYTTIDGGTYIGEIDFSLSLKNQETEPLFVTVYYHDGVTSNVQSVERSYNYNGDINGVLPINSNVIDYKLVLSNFTTQEIQFNTLSINNLNTPFSMSKTFLSQVFLIFLICYFIVCNLIFNRKKMYQFLHQYRWQIGCVMIVVLTFLEISGSSISLWSNYFRTSGTGVLFNQARMIRTDEWATNTPMAISQNYSNYAYFGNIIRGDVTDSFIVYGQPTYHIGEIFRPFHWGYLLLGSSMGLSFFWCARLIVLFLVTYDFCLWITNNDRNYSLLGAILISFAPLVQWWFAINGLVEMIIAFEGSLLLLNRYIDEKNWKKRFLYYLVILECAGMYVLTFYPAWMIPIAYILVTFIIYIFISRRKEIYFSKKDILCLIGGMMLFIGIMASIFLNSKDTIQAVLNTSYPGSRFETGGGMSSNLFSSFVTSFFCKRDLNLPSNVCELSMFVDLFPLGLIYSIWCQIKNKKKDSMLICLIALDVFFILYMTVGFIPLLSKITFMSNVQSGRTIVAFGIVNILLLIRSLSIYTARLSFKKTVFVSVLYSSMILVMSKMTYIDYMSKKKLLALAIACFILLFVLYYERSRKTFFVVIFSTYILVTGLLVNPVSQSLDVIDNSYLLNTVKKIQDSDAGLWIFEDEGYPTNNYLIMAGIPTINSTNVYPDLTRWESLDIGHRFESIYNRYAHISMKLSTNSDKFELTSPDSFIVYLDVEDLNTLNIHYIVSKNDLESKSNDLVHIECIDQVDEYKIFKVQS